MSGVRGGEAKLGRRRPVEGVALRHGGLSQPPGSLLIVARNGGRCKPKLTDQKRSWISPLDTPLPALALRGAAKHRTNFWHPTLRLGRISAWFAAHQPSPSLTAHTCQTWGLPCAASAPSLPCWS